jgi:hypothetical protein
MPVIRCITIVIVSEEETYDSIAVRDLRVDSVTWTLEQAEHIRTRSSRYPGAFDIEPEWATEASLNPRRLFGLDPASKTGEGIRVISRSEAASRVLTVILIPEEHPPGWGMVRGDSVGHQGTRPARVRNARGRQPGSRRGKRRGRGMGR